MINYIINKMESSFHEQTENPEQVKVVVRVRPLNTIEEKNRESSIIDVDVERNEIFVTKKKKSDSNPVHSSSKTEIKSFTFDAVFNKSTQQKAIYEKVFKDLVDSVLSGFNGTIFAYGQTGTGKTFTMEGSFESEDTFGVMPNAFKHIFEQVAQTRDKRYLIGASYFEIYQEEIRDLLSMESLKKCAIHEGPNGIHIKGLSSYLCSSFHEISELMVKGKKNRAVGATNMNEHSSRSHAVFQIIIETSDQADIEGEHIKVGKLNLVDLAGSERVAKTGAEGQRLKEASKINLSLSTLGNVISALVDGASFIPYRDSKLTRLLQDSLGGNSRTVMVATVGPARHNFEESMNTLRYASRAKSIENKPRINENPKDAVLRRYQEEINRLRTMVEEKRARKKTPGSTIITTEGGLKSPPPEEEVKHTSSKSKEINSKSVIQMMDASRIKELTEILEPLGIKFEGDIDCIRAKLQERTESLEKDTQMLKEDKEKLSTDLQKASEELQRAEFECNNLVAQIKWLESKVLNSSGENQLLQKMKSQEAEIELTEIELEKHKLRHEQLRQVLAEKEMTKEEAQATFTSTKNTLDLNVAKLEKITRKVANFGNERWSIERKHVEDIAKLRECSKEMAKELKLKKLIVDNFVPKKVRQDINQRMRYDKETETYFVESNENDPMPPPSIDRMLQFPLFNLTRFVKLKPIEKTFYTNENLLLLDPELPNWPVVDFVPDKINPKIEYLNKSAVKDLENTMIINCDHKTNKFRTPQKETPSYVAVGPAILLRKIRSEKFVDFSCVPSDINLNLNGANLCPLQIPQRTSSGAKFTQKQLLAFPLITYSGLGQLSFEDMKEEGVMQKDQSSLPSAKSRKEPLKIPKQKRSSNKLKGNICTPSMQAQSPSFSRMPTRTSSFSQSFDIMNIINDDDATRASKPDEDPDDQEQKLLRKLQYFTSQSRTPSHTNVIKEGIEAKKTTSKRIESTPEYPDAPVFEFPKGGGDEPPKSDNYSDRDSEFEDEFDELNSKVLDNCLRNAEEIQMDISQDSAAETEHVNFVSSRPPTRPTSERLKEIFDDELQHKQ